MRRRGSNLLRLWSSMSCHTGDEVLDISVSSHATESDAFDDESEGESGELVVQRVLSHKRYFDD